MWWRQYLAGKRKEDYLNWKKNYWRALFDRFDLWPPPGAAILDAGCGPAGAYLVLDACPVDAVDPLLDAYEKHLPHFSRTAYPQVRFFNSSLEQFKPACRYDRIFCLNALNHVDDLTACIGGLSLNLAPGGVLVCAVDVHRRAWLGKIFRILPGDILHPHQWTAAEYERLFHPFGLECFERQTLKKGLIFNYLLMKLRHRPETRAGHSS